MKHQYELGMGDKNEQVHKDREKYKQRVRQFQENVYNEAVALENKKLYERLVKVNTRESVFKIN